MDFKETGCGGWIWLELTQDPMAGFDISGVETSGSEAL
jgi:hypothetical protein